MPQMNLMGKRVLITNANVFMGPDLCKVFAEHGATIIESSDSLLSPDSAASLVASASQMDVLVVNLAVPAPSTAVTDVLDEEWIDTFSALVNPLPRLFRAVLPAMIARRAGKILVMGSASALRGMKRISTYSAARGAQLAYI
jgi:2-keto-3-deoxy-L-fuconate dehydrogenase